MSHLHGTHSNLSNSLNFTISKGRHTLWTELTSISVIPKCKLASFCQLVSGLSWTPPWMCLQTAAFSTRWRRSDRVELLLQSTVQRILLAESFRESLMRSNTVCSFCFWAISDWVTSATFSFSPSSFSGEQDSDKGLMLQDPFFHNSSFWREFTIDEISENGVDIIWYLWDIYLPKDSFILTKELL